MNDAAYKIPEPFEAAIAQAMKDAATSSIQTPNNNGPQALASAICRCLIQFCGFELAPVEGDPDPFDDPYVGAALLTGDGRVLSCHRKHESNEPHAEAQTLIAACESLATAGARELTGLIKQAYASKSWLRSDIDKQTFIQYFREAGRLVRNSHAQNDPRLKLYLISTLEPCKDFERQPGCSHLIAAFAPDEVWYGCDDTNPKGQGRPVIEAAHVPVLANLAVEENIRTNSLFYASVHYLAQLRRPSLSSSSRFAIRYLIAQLDRLKPEWTVGPADGRLQLRFGHLGPSVYEALPDAKLPILSPDSYNFEATIPDRNRVLFIDQFNPTMLLKYFAQHQAALRCIPGIVVCSREIEPGSYQDEVRKRLQQAKVRVYKDVQRRRDEHALALQLLLQGEVPANNLYVVIKTHDSYLRRAQNGVSLANELSRKTPEGTRRITVYLEAYRHEELLQFLRHLHGLHAFDQDHPLSQTSIHAILVETTDHISGDAARARVLAYLSSKGLSSRIAVEFERPDTAMEESAHDLRTELIAGRVDPVYIGGRALDKLLAANSWKDRQAAGLLLDAAARRDPLIYPELIINNLPTSFEATNWRQACSVLNAIAKLGLPDAANERARLRTQMLALSDSLDRASADGDVRPELLDVVWRFIAASTALEDEELIRRCVFEQSNLRQFIAREPFLLKELFFYSSRSESCAAVALMPAVRLLDACVEDLTDAQRQQVLLRLTRLSTTYRHSHMRESEECIRKIRDRWQALARQCDEERIRCERVLCSGLKDVFTGQHGEGPQSFCSYLFVRTADPDTAVEHTRGLVAAVQDQVLRSINSGFHQKEVVWSWRADKTSLARLALSEVTAQVAQEYLCTMARDEDETIRWAAIVLALDVSLRRSALGDRPSRAQCHEVRRRTSDVINTVLSGRVHYWLHRELLELFANEHNERNPLPADARLQMIDMPQPEKWIFGDGLPQLHPEVDLAMQKVRRGSRRVALVLPPLQKHGESGIMASKTSTPPLGIGSIASFLLSRGHFVKVVDCHRFPSLAADCLSGADRYDVIGFSVVNSTFQSVRTLVNHIKINHASAPTVVVGGHAPTLMPYTFIEDDGFRWDYLVMGDGERPMAAIVEGALTDQDMASLGIIKRAASVVNVPRFAITSSADWDELPWIDRRVFTRANGVPYEPSLTRNGGYSESHLVMSRGCGWKCSFCTEAVLRGNAGEVRRSSTDVLEEIAYLAARHNVQRIQFVDDNLLPQIAAPSADVDRGLRWSEGFLSGMAELSHGRHGTKGVGWRGIFRLEDFVLYEKHLTDWIQLLKNSGCMLLAFGIESGNEARRAQLKAGTVSNERIRTIVRRLDAAEIASKGYFIIGGHDESDATANETIDFAVSSGLTLAYFALYKDFRRPIQLGRDGKWTSDQHEAAYLRFATLSEDLGKVVLGCTSTQDAQKLFGPAISIERIEAARIVLAELESLGFRFDDLFKYNDYHASIDDHNDLLSIWAGNDAPQSAFLAAVRRAYFEFYTRRKFIGNYQSLLQKGY